MGASARLADLPMVLERGTRHRRIPNPGAADLGALRLADPEAGDVTSSSDALSEADLRTAAEFVSSYLTDESQAAIADHLEAAADALAALREAQE